MRIHAIREGKKRSRLPGIAYNKDKWSVTFILHESCWRVPSEIHYETTTIFGVGDWEICFLPEYQTKNLFKVYAVGGLAEEYIGDVKAGKPCSIMVEYIGDKAWFSCLDLGAFVNIPCEKSRWEKVRYPERPYATGWNEVVFLEIKGYGSSKTCKAG